jgi:hypothetical protein
MFDDGDVVEYKPGQYHSRLLGILCVKCVLMDCTIYTVRYLADNRHEEISYGNRSMLFEDWKMI